ncbi:MarR family transcriptional regulator [Halovenus carboxidivorans]|uniref:MarR family transcriptional regulator n=1 Tax=Halovenus carboxidivorans TaxID=2692199 RepID=UPI0019150995|nr:helix-turn-helix domain-containing protein [Halovenus carboxidivorans]
MGDNTEPDWLTDMDLEILDVLSTNLVLSPSIIAENIDRSREGVSNRLNSLQAGELVEKVERGKYQITEEGSRVYVGKEEYGKDDWYSPEKLGWDEEDQERLAEIREELNVSEKEFQLRVRNEYNSIIREGPEFEDPLREAEKRVIERLRDEEN